MLMAMHIENTMTLKTYHAMNKTLLGSFKSRSEGTGDTTVARSFAAEKPMPANGIMALACHCQPVRLSKPVRF